MPQTKINYKQPQFLWFLTLSYAIIMVLANWFDPRLINIGGLVTDAGTLIFPLTFLLSDLITEVYGYKNARRAIWCGFMFNAIFILYAQLIIHLPSPSYPTQNDIFDQLLAADYRIILASALSYLASEPINSFIMAKLKIKMYGKFPSIRFLSSTIIASCIDSCIFGIIAFGNTMSNVNLLALILTMWTIKILIEILGLPISLKLSKILKLKEEMDIYDKQTNFNIFRLETKYLPNDNEFRQHP